MMSDTKAVRAAELLRQYCAERGCDGCVFRAQHGFCILQSAKLPEDWKLEGLGREEQTDER